jgi:hypothetical protein
MTKSGERNKNQIVNALMSTWDIIRGKRERYKCCVAQEESVRFKLEKEEYDDKWTFESEVSEIFGLPIHTKGKARSENPDDPIITYDPWKDKFCVDYGGKKDGVRRFKEFSKFVKSTIKNKGEDGN